MGKWIHILTERNLKNKTAICKKCGFVRIDNKGVSWRCHNAVLEDKHPELLGVFNMPKNVPKNTKCEICKNLATVRDHNHNSNMFRGFLCRRCNLGLGNFMDNTNNLKMAIIYLTSKLD